jgi:hypothetical protein
MVAPSGTKADYQHGGRPAPATPGARPVRWRHGLSLQQVARIYGQKQYAEVSAHRLPDAPGRAGRFVGPSSMDRQLLKSSGGVTIKHSLRRTGKPFYNRHADKLKGMSKYPFARVATSGQRRRDTLLRALEIGTGPSSAIVRCSAVRCVKLSTFGKCFYLNRCLSHAMSSVAKSPY